jgi:hypothetical protein
MKDYEVSGISLKGMILQEHCKWGVKNGNFFFEPIDNFEEWINDRTETVDGLTVGEMNRSSVIQAFKNYILEKQLQDLAILPFV